MRRLMVLVPVLLFSVAACGGADQPPPSPAPAASSTQPPASAHATTTTAAPPAKPTLAGLVEDPCQAVTDADATRLNVFVKGSETPDPTGKSCQWGAQGALITFTPYLREDKTKTDAKDLSPATIAGHHARLGQLSHGGDTGYFVFVATDPGSFRLLATGFGEDTPGPDPVTVAKNFAKAILNRLA